MSGGNAGTWGDAPSPGMAGFGGNHPMRPDQALNAGHRSLPLPPGAQSGEIIARLVIIRGPSGVVTGLFLYAPGTTPGPGNPPVISITGASTDPFGNPVTPGLDMTEGIISGPITIDIGSPGGSQVNIIPDTEQAFDVTSAIAGIMQAVVQLITTDAAEVMPGMMGSVLLAAGAATKMSTVLHSPFGTQGAALALQAQNDGGTDTPVITFGTVTLPDGSTMVFTPILTLTPYAMLLYSGASGQTAVTKTAGSGTIPIPAGVTTAKGEVWAAGGGGIGASGGAAGAGEYAAEPALAVTGGGTVAYSVGAAGAAGVGLGAGGNGGNSTLTGTSVTVTAHGGTGASGASGAAGGTGSANTAHHDGGAGGAGGLGGGGGGGGSGGTGSAGHAGGSATGSAPGAGATAVAGGGPGGAGGGTNVAGSSPATGPGGGGGSAGTGPSHPSGGAGSAGQVRVTYSSGAPPILLSIAAAAGTDQFGTAYPANIAYSAASGTGNLLSLTNTTSTPGQPAVQLATAAAGDNTLGIKVTGDSSNRLRINSDGKILWGPGNVTQDTDLFRGGAGILQTDSTLAITNQAAPGALAGTGQLYAANGQLAAVNASGLNYNVTTGQPANFNKNSVTGAAFANLSSFTIPANDAAIVGATYEFRIFGYGQWGNPATQLTLQGNLGGTQFALTAIAAGAFAASAVFQWNAVLTVACTATGSGGTWRCSLSGAIQQTANSLNPGTAASNSVAFSLGEGSAADIAGSTLGSLAVQLAAEWASAANGATITKSVSYPVRIA